MFKIVNEEHVKIVEDHENNRTSFSHMYLITSNDRLIGYNKESNALYDKKNRIICRLHSDEDIHEVTSAAISSRLLKDGKTTGCELVHSAFAKENDESNVIIIAHPFNGRLIPNIEITSEYEIHTEVKHRIFLSSARYSITNADNSRKYKKIAYFIIEVDNAKDFTVLIDSYSPFASKSKDGVYTKVDGKFNLDTTAYRISDDNEVATGFKHSVVDKAVIDNIESTNK